MANRPAPFRQADLSRALKAASAAGLDVGRVEIDPVSGKIVIITGKSDGAKDTAGDRNEVRL